MRLTPTLCRSRCPSARRNPVSALSRLLRGARVCFRKVSAATTFDCDITAAAPLAIKTRLGDIRRWYTDIAYVLRPWPFTISHCSRGSAVAADRGSGVVIHCLFAQILLQASNRRRTSFAMFCQYAGLTQKLQGSVRDCIRFSFFLTDTPSSTLSYSGPVSCRPSCKDEPKMLTHEFHTGSLAAPRYSSVHYGLPFCQPSSTKILCSRKSHFIFALQRY